MPNVTITFSEEEQMQIEEIVIDRDEKGALEFIKQVIKARIDKQRQAHCRPPI